MKSRRVCDLIHLFLLVFLLSFCIHFLIPAILLIIISLFNFIEGIKKPEKHVRLVLQAGHSTSDATAPVSLVMYYPALPLPVPFRHGGTSPPPVRVADEETRMRAHGPSALPAPTGLVTEALMLASWRLCNTHRGGK